MKRLILLRHAKAVAKHPVRDFERPLAPRGRAQMKAVAAYLAEHGPEGLQPDLALVSPAARTRETWSAAELAGVAVRFEPGIYEASAEALLALARATEAGVGTLLIVGHNPAMEELADALAGRGDDLALAKLRSGFPTAALAALVFEATAWREIASGGGRLERFVTPADLGLGKDA